MEHKLCKGCPEAQPLTDKSENPNIIVYFCTILKRKVKNMVKECPMLGDSIYD